MPAYRHASGIGGKSFSPFLEFLMSHHPVSPHMACISSLASSWVALRGDE
ncbi:MAG: hypothetical protein WB762_01410 [Candidatus Sulfotelmatobacter sp.]